ncbi:MAG: acyl-[ACP]--phospholipid O-acyltransferase [Planctomycetota bacterium JB042]
MADAPHDGRRGRLGALLVAQFLGAFNDNAWKLLVVVLAGRTLVDLPDAEREVASQTKTMLAFVVFTLPLLVFSLPAGALADRVSKRSVVVATKGLELLLLSSGAALLFLDPTAEVALLVVLAGMGVQSALFSPAKYGILPELVPHEELSRANGQLELWTFVAIIAGTALGPWLVGAAGTRPALAAVALAVLAAVGLVVALRVPRTPPARTEGTLGGTVAAAVAVVRDDRALLLAILGSTWFWAVASLLGQDLLVYAATVLRLDESLTGVPMAVFGLGVGVGAVAAGRLSSGKIETGLVPLGAVGLGGFTLLFGWIGPGFAGTCVLMALLGLSSGLLVVPLNALLQWRAPAGHRGAVIALSNVFVFLGMLVGSWLGWKMALAGLSPRGIALGAAGLTLLGTAWALWLLPEAFLRLVLFLVTRSLYRVKVLGRAHVPETGGVLLAPNHVSFVDGLLLIATLDRPVRFIVDRGQFERTFAKPFLKLMKAIPIEATGGPRGILRALKEAGRFLEEGEVVCIFPEGQITRTGALLPFRRGLERISKGRPAPIVPVHLDRMWGSIFSFAKGRFLFKVPEEIPYPVTVSYGAPLPPGTPVTEVRDAVQALGEVAWAERKHARRPLHRTFLKAARRRPLRLALHDEVRGGTSRFAAATGAIALARALRPEWDGHERVGLLLPPSVVGALANVAASIAGKTVVNLNYTAGPAGMGSAARQAGLANVVTSRTFLEKAKLELPEGVPPVFLEDVAPRIGGGAKLVAACLAATAPARWIERACGAPEPIDVDDVATVLFSSGSTGEPKGVQLTHFNIDSNVEAIAQVFRPAPDDRLLGILPLFHALGTTSLWFALNHGAAVVFHPNPLDAATVGRLVEKHRVTLLLATPTFLQLYLRRCAPEQFGSLRLVMAGAEKLTERLAAEFERAFGIRPLEGYGATECAPVVAAGVPSFRAPGFYQAGSKRGFVGPPVPGVSVRVVDPETGEPLPVNRPGLLLARGPNVMKGYLGRDDLTEKVLRDGWYDTGDIAMVDEDGFVKITDRLSRFSKIGGEMVPHGKVEEALHEAYGAKGEQRFCVTAIEDERKGERLAVVATVREDEVPGLLEELSRQGLPNLFVPRKDSFVLVDALPVLGTGKIDLKAVKTMAAERLT